MKTGKDTEHLETRRLNAEIAELRARVEIAEGTLEAIRGGGVDAFVVATSQGEKVYTLQGADHPYRMMIEQMQQGAATVSSDGIILYANRHLACLLNIPLEEILGQKLERFVPPEALPGMLSFDSRPSVCELNMRRPDGARVPVMIATSPLPGEAEQHICAVITDLTERRKTEDLKQAYRAEQDISRTLQEALVPPSTEPLDEVTISHAYIGATDNLLVGGDFFDVFSPAPGLVAVAIGDIAGKGLDAAIESAIVKHMLRAYAFEDPTPASVLGRLNRILCVELASTFVTLFYGLIDLKLMELVFANAGHEPPLWLLPKNAKVKKIHRPPVPLCIDSSTEYGQYRIQLCSGHRLLLYTDGVTEARGDAGFYGVERLERFMLENQHLDADHLVKDLISHVRDFSAGRPRDDIAVLLVCIR